MRLIAVPMLCLALAARAEPAPLAPAALPADEQRQQEDIDGAARPAEALPLRARLDRDAIRAAIADLPAEAQANPRRHGGDTFGAAPGATPYEGFSQDFARARLPNCLQSEGLRNQPTFFLTGVLALPFIAVAKVRGVCR